MRGSRQGWLAALGVTSLALVLALIITGLLNLRARVDDATVRGNALQSNLDRSQSAVDALSRQVKSLGATPVATPSLEPVPGPQGPMGLSIVGPTGPQGSPGPSGSPGATGPRGPQGATGTAGATGAAGQDGKDGADGAPGKDGADGATGQQGSPGPDCPSWQDDKWHDGYQVCTRPSPTPTGGLP